MNRFQFPATYFCPLMKNGNRVLEKWRNWELWPVAMIYAPLGPLWLWYALKAKSFWFFTPTDPTITFGGFDGEEWLMEAVDKGRYSAVYRWAPQDCGDSTTRKLAILLKHLATESRIDAILNAIGAPNSGL